MSLGVDRADEGRAAGVPPARWRGVLAVLGCVVAGAAAALLGLLPWLRSGARLPLQNLWAEQALPEDMPVALLPVSQYYPTVVLALVVVGSAVAGVLVRSMRRRLPRGGVLAVVAGALLVQVTAAVQSTVTVAGGLGDRLAATLYLAAAVVMVVGSVLAGLVVLGLMTARPRAAAVLGLVLTSLVLGTWLAVLASPLGSVASDPVVRGAVAAERWVPAVGVGAAIAWGGLGTRGRRVVAAVAQLTLWVVPALVTAVTSAVGSRVLLPYPAEMLAYGLQVLPVALLQPAVALPPLLVAVAVAAAGTGIRRLVGDGAGGRVDDTVAATATRR